MLKAKVLQDIIRYSIDSIWLEEDRVCFIPKNNDNIGKGCNWGKLEYISYNYIYNHEILDKCISWTLGKGYEIFAQKPIVQDDEGRQVINYWYKAYICKVDIGSYDAPYQILDRKYDINTETYREAIFQATNYVWDLYNETKKRKVRANNSSKFIINEG